MKVIENGSLEFNLTRSERDRTVRLVKRLDFERDGTLRERVWTVDGGRRTLTVDVRRRKVEPQAD